jgi:hypothetical protein
MLLFLILFGMQMLYNGIMAGILTLSIRFNTAEVFVAWLQVFIKAFKTKLQTIVLRANRYWVNFSQQFPTLFC